MLCEAFIPDRQEGLWLVAHSLDLPSPCPSDVNSAIPEHSRTFQRTFLVCIFKMFRSLETVYFGFSLPCNYFIPSCPDSKLS